MERPGRCRRLDTSFQAPLPWRPAGQQPLTWWLSAVLGGGCGMTSLASSDIVMIIASAHIQMPQASMDKHRSTARCAPVACIIVIHRMVFHYIFSAICWSTMVLRIITIDVHFPIWHLQLSGCLVSSLFCLMSFRLPTILFCFPSSLPSASCPAFLFATCPLTKELYKIQQCKFPTRLDKNWITVSQCICRSFLLIKF